MTDDAVRSQYEAYPYPERDPRDEAKRLVTGSPSHLDELNHYVFAGRRDFTRPFRALVAGGGTGDAAIMLAQQLKDTGGPGEVVYTDLSQASRAVCEARAEARGLDNIRFESLAIEAVADSGLGPFDYVDCCGVLHHLADPEAGLKALASVLAPGGGMGVMVYGELGRTGVYHAQEMLRLLADDAPDADRLQVTRRLLGQLPESNWLKRNPFVGDHFDGTDAGLYDLLLHRRDRAYRVPDLAGLAAAAGLAVSGFILPLHYDPATYVTDPVLLKRLAGLSRVERAAFAELLAGNMRKHIVYLVPEDRAGDAVAEPADETLVPVLCDLDRTAWARQFKPGSAMTAKLEGLALRFSLPPLAGALVGRMDGLRSIGDIRADLAAAGIQTDAAAFDRQWADLYRVFNGLGRLHLRGPA